MDSIMVENEKFAKLLIEKGADVTYTVGSCTRVGSARTALIS